MVSSNPLDSLKKNLNLTKQSNLQSLNQNLKILQKNTKKINFLLTTKTKQKIYKTHTQKKLLNFTINLINEINFLKKNIQILKIPKNKILNFLPKINYFLKSIFNFKILIFQNVKFKLIKNCLNVFESEFLNFLNNFESQIKNVLSHFKIQSKGELKLHAELYKELLPYFKMYREIIRDYYNVDNSDRNSDNDSNNDIDNSNSIDNSKNVDNSNSIETYLIKYLKNILNLYLKISINLYISEFTKHFHTINDLVKKEVKSAINLSFLIECVILIRNGEMEFIKNFGIENKKNDIYLVINYEKDNNIELNNNIDLNNNIECKERDLNNNIECKENNKDSNNNIECEENNILLIKNFNSIFDPLIDSIIQFIIDIYNNQKKETIFMIFKILKKKFFFKERINKIYKNLIFLYFKDFKKNKFGKNKIKKLKSEMEYFEDEDLKVNLLRVIVGNLRNLEEFYMVDGILNKYLVNNMVYDRVDSDNMVDNIKDVQENSKDLENRNEINNIFDSIFKNLKNLPNYEELKIKMENDFDKQILEGKEIKSKNDRINERIRKLRDKTIK